MKGQFTFNDQTYYEMPVHFRNRPYTRGYSVVYRDNLTLGMKQKTDIEALARYIPDCFELLRGEISWSYTNCRQVDFMRNGEYRIFSVSAPVSFTTHDGKTLVGGYPLVIFEDRFEPVVGGREACGMPKLLCEISTDHHVGAHWFVHVSSASCPMLELNFFEEKKLPEEAVAAATPAEPGNSFGYRCMPAVESGGVDYAQVIRYPQKGMPRELWSGTGNVKIFLPEPEHWYVNTYYKILASLAELPNEGFFGAYRSQGALELFCNAVEDLK